jgi:two-component system, chemotaxis family, protein-glutamate methylesterase/glutaminase
MKTYPQGKIRVLVVDDSSFIRGVITEMLSGDEHISVIDTAGDGKEALQKTMTLNPDVVTLDVLMPDMDGLTTLDNIMKKWPTPVIMISAIAKAEAEVTFRALELGAVDFITKPTEVDAKLLKTVQEELIKKIKIAAQINKAKLKTLYPSNIARDRIFLNSKPAKKAVAIGISTGGPRALMDVLSQFPPDLPAGVLIAQHMPPFFVQPFMNHLSERCSIQIKEANTGNIVGDSSILIAPKDFTIRVEKVEDNGVIKLSREASPYKIKPYIDLMMKSMAKVYGRRSIGVLMTGMGRDGVEGIRAIKKAGGKTLAQDESSSVIFGMAKVAIEEGLIDKVLPLEQLAEEIMNML